MAVYITVSTDSFDSGDAMRVRPSQLNVRRPLRGIEIKEDTYAILRVIRSDGTDMQLFDSSSPNFDDAGVGRSGTYTNFIVQSAREQRVEKQQIIHTFGEDYIFFFGEQPRFLDVSGVLMNTKDFNWKNEFLANYEEYLRGTRLVEQNARLYFYFDDIVVEGYMVNSTVSQEANQPHLVQFQFQLFVTQYSTLSHVGSVYSGTMQQVLASYLEAGAETPVFGPHYNNEDEYPVRIGNRRWDTTPPIVQNQYTNGQVAAAAHAMLEGAGVDAGSREAQSTIENGSGVRPAGGDMSGIPPNPYASGDDGIAPNPYASGDDGIPPNPYEPGTQRRTHPHPRAPSTPRRRPARIQRLPPITPESLE